MSYVPTIYAKIELTQLLIFFSADILLNDTEFNNETEENIDAGRLEINPRNSERLTVPGPALSLNETDLYIEMAMLVSKTIFDRCVFSMHYAMYAVHITQNE